MEWPQKQTYAVTSSWFLEDAIIHIVTCWFHSFHLMGGMIIHSLKLFNRDILALDMSFAQGSYNWFPYYL